MASSSFSFKIDSNLDRIWSSLGLSESERADELEKLEVRLLSTYRDFSSEACQLLETMRGEVTQCESQIQRVQQTYGPAIVPSLPADDMPTKGRLTALRHASSELTELCQARQDMFTAVQAEADELFLCLGIGEADRGEFKEVGDSDFTPERFTRYRNLIDSLNKEKQQRQSLFQSLNTQLQFLNDELEEAATDDVQAILDRHLLTTPALDQLKRAADGLEKVKIKRRSEFDQLASQLRDLYSLLAIDNEKRLQQGKTIPQAAITALRKEIATLQDEKESRLPFVIRGMKRELLRLCIELRLPIPKFGGDDLEEETKFFARQVSEVRQKKIETQPLSELITQITSYRELLDAKPSPAQAGSPRRNLEEERLNRIARE
jgi:hypothetical protein